jgi:dipeptidase E
MKKLVLYSDQIPPLTNEIDTELEKLLNRPNPRIAFIPASSDPERNYYTERKNFYSELGMEMDVYFELDKEWRPDLLKSLLDCDAIHLSGGNTYYFLHWLRRRNMMDILVRYVDRGGVLIGVSAGSILMTPDISSSALCGDEVLEGESDFSGLGLVDFSFVPHFGDIPVDLDDLKQYSRDKRMPVYAASDSGGIVVLENEIKCIGDVIEIDER